MVFDQGFSLIVLFLKPRNSGKPQQYLKDLSIQRPASSHLYKLAAPTKIKKEGKFERKSCSGGLATKV